MKLLKTLVMQLLLPMLLIQLLQHSKLDATLVAVLVALHQQGAVILVALWEISSHQTSTIINYYVYLVLYMFVAFII